MSELEEECSRSRGHFMRVAYGILHNMEDAEDAVQEALILAYRKIDQFSNEHALRAWLSTIVRNSALDLIRRNRFRLSNTVGLDSMLHEPPARDRDIEGRLIFEEREDTMYRLIESLPPKQKTAIICYLDTGEVGANKLLKFRATARMRYECRQAGASSTNAW